MTESATMAQTSRSAWYGLPELNIRRLLELAGSRTATVGQWRAEYMRFAESLTQCPDARVPTVLTHWQSLRSEEADRRAAARIIDRCGLESREDGSHSRDCSGQTDPSVDQADASIRRWILSHLGDPAVAGRSSAIEAAAARWSAEDITERWATSEYARTERMLLSAYRELTADLRVVLDGASFDFDHARALNAHPDRTIRYKARLGKWSALAERSDELQDIFGRIVRVRAAGAHTLGFETFSDLANLLRRRSRTTETLMQQALAEIETGMAPELTRARLDQARRLGLAELMLWDESAPEDVASVPTLPDAVDQIEIIRNVLTDTFPGFGDMWATLIAEGLIDLYPRPTRLPGGFCSGLAGPRLPVVATAFHGSSKDVEILVHELGHAYQRWLCRSAEFPDLWAAPSPNSEISAVSFELLAIRRLQPLYRLSHQAVADRRIREMLAQVVYAAAVEAFEREIYAHPSMSATDRCDLWSDIERRYMPWRRYGDIPLACEGGLWLDQRHIFTLPHYYSDYAIAGLHGLNLYHADAAARPAVAVLVAACADANLAEYSVMNDRLRAGLA